MLRRFLAALALVLAFTATQASAQSLTTYTFATLPGSPTAGQLAWITDNSGTPTVGSPAAGGAAAGNRDLVAYDLTQTRWEFVARQPVAGPTTPLQKLMDAARISYSNVLYALVDSVQGALDLLFSYGYAFVSYMTAYDADRDGEFEWTLLRDFDGDGSGPVLCLAKNSPDPACGAALDIVYRDFSDDMSCGALGCGFGKMALTGTVKLLPGVSYVVWPCWEPTNTRNPSTATTEVFHDTTARAAYSDCPAIPGTSRRAGALTLAGWQGTIEGAGVDTRNPNTTTNYRRNVGSYIVNDMGPTWNNGGAAGNCTSTWEGCNSWWGQLGFVRGINSGFAAVHTSVLTNFINAGSDAGDDPTSKGYSTASGDQLVNSMDGSLCVVEATMGSLVAGDEVIIYGNSDNSGAPTQTVSAMLRVLSYDLTDCNGAGTAKINLGGAVAGQAKSDLFVAKTDVPHIIDVKNGYPVVEARADMLNPGAKIRNVTLTANDPWNDSSGTGDCTSPTTSPSYGAWTFADDVLNSDFDCDTNPMVGIWGGGRFTIEDSVIMRHGAYSIDGESNIGNPMIRRVLFMYGNGGPIMDAGSGWNMRDLEVWEGLFSSNLISVFGPGLRLDGLKIYNSSILQIAQLGGQAVDDTFENIEVDSSQLMHAFALSCGARLNRFRDITLSNMKGTGSTQVYRTGLGAELECADTTKPIEFNSFENFRVTGSGFADLDGYGPDTNNVLFILNAHSIIGNSRAGAIVRNRFVGNDWRFAESGAGFKACMFGAQDWERFNTDGNRAGNYDLEQLFANQVFYGNTIANVGATPGTAWMYCDGDLHDGTPPAGQYNSFNDVAKGGVAGGVNARGCMNTIGTATVSSSLQTCN